MDRGNRRKLDFSRVQRLRGQFGPLAKRMPQHRVYNGRESFLGDGAGVFGNFPQKGSFEYNRGSCIGTV